MENANVSNQKEVKSDDKSLPSSDSKSSSSADPKSLTSSDPKSSTSSDPAALNSANDDPELDDLLDNAIEDFGKAPPKVTAENPDKSSEEAASTSNEWFNELVEQVSEQFDGELKDYLQQVNEGKDIADLLGDENFQKLMENTSQLLEKETGGSGEPENLKDTISETLKNLSEGIENLHSSLPEDELPNMFNGLNMSDDMMMPFMQNIMEMFLSKEVLHPSMDALCKSFPAWLHENEPVLSKEDYDKYNQQYELMLIIIKKLEEENPNDPPDVKKERFSCLFELMQKLQKFGHPPKELIADYNVPLNLKGSPQLPSDFDPSKCSMM